MAGKERKVVDSTFVLPRRRGNGIVRREVWVDAHGRICRYNLAYINHGMFAGDNGRVLGYDNAHDFHHRHRFGNVTLVRCVDFVGVEADFEVELSKMLKEARKWVHRSG